MTAAPVSLLLLEDNPDDARLVQRALAKHAAGEFAVRWAERLAEALALLGSERFDAVLSDLGLPDSSGLETARAIAARAPALPLVILTSMHDEELGRAAIRHGAQDYLVKGASGEAMIARTLHFAIERKRLQATVREANELLERRVAERTAELQATLREARENAARYLALTEMAMDAIITVDDQHNIVLFNPAAERMFGYPAAEVIGQPLERLLPEQFRATHREHVRKFRGGANAMGRTTAVFGLRSDGSQFPAEVSISRIMISQGTFYTAILRDVTERKRAERALRESEERFRSLTQLSSDFFWETDAEHRLTLRGPGSKQSTIPEIRAGAQIGKRRWELPYLSPDAAGWKAHAAILDAHLPFRDFEFSRSGDGGAERFISISGEPIFDESGGFKGYRGVGSDITERRRTAKLLALEHSVTRLFAQTRDTGQALRGAIQSICESETWGYGRYLWVDDAAGVLRFGEAWAVPEANIQRHLEESRPMVYAPGQGLVGAVWQSQQPLWVPDVSNDPRVARPALAQAMGLRGALVVPVIAETRVIGVLIFHSRQVREPDERLLQTIRVIGAQIGQFVHRAHAERALRESEERLRTIFEGALDGILVANAQTGKFLAANREICSMLGYSPGEIVRLGVPDIHREQDRAHALDQFERLRRGEIRMAADVPVVRKDGSLFFADIKAAPVRLGGVDGMLGVFRDVTERKRAEAQMRLQAAALESAANAIVITDREGVILWVNRAFSALTGYAPEEVIGQNPRRLKSGTHGPEFYRHMYDTILAGEVWRGEIVNRYKDGRLGSEQMIITPVRATGGEVTHFIAIKEDITERLEQQRKIERLNRIRALMGAVNSLIVRTHDRDELHREACRIAVEHGGFGMAWIGRYDEKSATVKVKAWAGFEGERFAEIHVPVGGNSRSSLGLAGRALRDRAAVFENDLSAEPGLGLTRSQAIRLGFRSAIALPLFVKDRITHVMLLYTKEPGFFDAEELKLLNEMAADLSFSLETIKREARLAYLSQYDLLTGLANRTLFGERLAQHLRTRADDETTVATVLFDIERLQVVNDSFGQHEGDELLKQFAQRLVQAFGREELVARVVSDCFAAIVRGVKVAGDLAHLLEQTVLPALAQPFEVGGTELRVGMKVGIALFPSDGHDPETVYRNAEAALRKAKASGERYLFYSQEMNARVAEMLSLETKLRRALEREEFVLHYQPKLEVRSGRILGLEALMRWNDADAGLVPPARFIPVLEETGMIREAGRWALRQAIADLGRWRAMGLATRAAVNVSLAQLRQRDFVPLVHAVLDEAPGDHGLDLEITESLLMEDVEESIGKLRALRARGVNIAIDDFGTGYSSLSYLGRLPVNALKIDRSFIVAMTRGPEGLALVSTIISLARSFNFAVVAEGVDAEEQLELLRRLRCDEWQGFLYSKPVPAAQVPELLRAPPFGT